MKTEIEILGNDFDEYAFKISYHSEWKVSTYVSPFVFGSYDDAYDGAITELSRNN